VVGRRQTSRLPLEAAPRPLGAAVVPAFVGVPLPYFYSVIELVLVLALEMAKPA
jgi:hypothetical protein